MDETFNWFTKADLSKYEDKYISIVDKEVVCADDDPEVAYTIAKEKYPDKEVVLWKVPHGENFIFQAQIERVPFLLGRESLFERFDITFQQRKRKTIFVWQKE